MIKTGITQDLETPIDVLKVNIDTQQCSEATDLTFDYELPAPILKRLHSKVSAVSKKATPHEKKRAIFFDAFSRLMINFYDSFPQQFSPDEFSRKAELFVNLADKKAKPFLATLTQTQMFSNFCDLDYQSFSKIFLKEKIDLLKKGKNVLGISIDVPSSFYFKIVVFFSHDSFTLQINSGENVFKLTHQEYEPIGVLFPDESKLPKNDFSYRCWPVLDHLLFSDRKMVVKSVQTRNRTESVRENSFKMNQFHSLLLDNIPVNLSICFRLLIIFETEIDPQNSQQKRPP